MKKHTVILIIFFNLIFSALKGQDIHFSQFYAAPLMLNPALTGQFPGDYRAGIQYRDQYRSIPVPYQTFEGFFDTRLPFGSMKQQFSAGLWILNDQAGDGNLSSNKTFATFSFNQNLGNGFWAGVGIGAGFIQKKLDYSALVFDDQWTQSGFDPGVSTAEPAGQQPLKYPDMQAGILISYEADKDRVFYGGISLNHLLKPKESFISSGNRLDFRWTVNAGGHFLINDFLAIDPALIYMNQDKASEWIIGANAAYLPANLPVESLILGLWGRASGDIISSVGADYHRVRLLISYDLNISSLKTVSQYRGGTEMSLLYTWKRKHPPLQEIIVPCIRF